MSNPIRENDELPLRPAPKAPSVRRYEIVVDNRKPVVLTVKTLVPPPPPPMPRLEEHMFEIKGDFRMAPRPPRLGTLMPANEIVLGSDGQIYRASELGWGIPGVSALKKVAKKGVSVAKKGVKASVKVAKMPTQITTKVVKKLPGGKFAVKTVTKVAAKAKAAPMAIAKTTGKVALKAAKVVSKPVAMVAEQIKKYGLKIALAPVIALFNRAVNMRVSKARVPKKQAAAWVANLVKAKMGPLGGTFVFLLKQSGTTVGGEPLRISMVGIQSRVGAIGIDDYAAIITAASAALALIMKTVNFAQGVKTAVAPPPPPAPVYEEPAPAYAPSYEQAPSESELYQAAETMEQVEEPTYEEPLYDE